MASLPAFSPRMLLFLLSFFSDACVVFSNCNPFHLISQVSAVSASTIFFLIVTHYATQFNFIMVVVALTDKINTNKASYCILSYWLVCFKYAQNLTE